MMSSSSEAPATPTLPIEVFARVFPLLHDDPKSWYNLAETNRQLHHISKSFGGPQKWPDFLVDFEQTQHADFDYYVHQVKYSPNGKHIALMLRVYEGSDATDYHRIVRIVDIDHGPIQDISVGRSTPFTAYCGHYYFIAVEPRLVRVFGYSRSCRQEEFNYRQVQVIPSANRIVGIKVFNDSNEPKIVLQTEDPHIEGLCTLVVWDLLLGVLLFEIPYTGSSNFDVSDDGRVFACIDGGFDVGSRRPVRTIFMDSDGCRPYVSDLPGNPRRHWIDTCSFSPDGQRLAVLTEERIFQLDTSVEPPQWIDGCCLMAPDDCTFSGQMQYSPDSQRLLAHARTPWDNVYRGNENNLNTLQIWDANNTFQLIATKGFHDLVGSVGLSPDGKFVVVIQGDDSDVFRSAIARIVTRYVAAMDDYSPYPEHNGGVESDIVV